MTGLEGLVATAIAVVGLASFGSETEPIGFLLDRVNGAKSLK